MGMWSNAGAYASWNVASPKFANIAVGYAYSVVFSNQTAADITTGTFTFEGADADPNDWCIPGPFTPLETLPVCDDPNAVVGPATITLTPEAPIRAGQQCAFAIECPKQFLTVSGAPGGLDIICTVTHLRRTNFGQAA